jgi:hypothetical protein
MTMQRTADSPPDPAGAAPGRTPAIIGFLIAGAVILGLGFLAGLRGGGGDGDSAVPPLHILAPAHGDTVTNPVILRFYTPAALRIERFGWGAGDLHVHVMADAREIMPAAADIESDGDAFVWRLPPLDAGPRRLYLTWAARDHRNLVGIADTVLLHVMP